MQVRASLTPCPGDAFITIEYGVISEKMEIERVLDAAGAKEEGRENVLWEFFRGSLWVDEYVGLFRYRLYSRRVVG